MNKIIHRLDYPKDVDKMMVPLLDVLNSIPGCRTLYSCSGHGNSEFYVSLAICSSSVMSKIARIFKWKMLKHKIKIQDDEINMDLPIDGLLPYEGYLGLYSKCIGHLSYKKRKGAIKHLTDEFLDLVPENLWDNV